MISREIDDKHTVPLQILIALGLKHLKLTDKYNECKEVQCSEIVALAQAWYDIWDVEVESIFEYTMSVDTYPLILFNQMVVDKFCILKQYSRRYILCSSDNMIQPLFSKAGKCYTYKEYKKVVVYLIELSGFIRSINIVKMKKEIDVANYKIDLILQEISIESNRVNSNFISLDSECNYYRWPLIRFPMNQYVYVDYHICGWGFYYAAYEMIKRVDESIDRKQGELVENMLKAELKEKKFRFMCGKYSALKEKNLNESECDLVIQNKDTFFFEMKKTSVTDELDKIDEVMMLQQLAKGMLKAQKQCFAHELYLKTNNFICLNNNGKEDVLRRMGEQDRCFKISVCYPEYSFLCSKNFCSFLLETLMIGECETVDPTRKSELDELNGLGKKIVSLILQTKKHETINARDEAFFSLFCSMQQVLTALWNSVDENDFLEMVKEWIYCQNKTLDPYCQILLHIYHQEHPEESNMQKAAIDMFERTGKKCMFVGV